MQIVRQCVGAWCLGALLLAATAHAQTVVVAGVPYPQHITLQEQPLHLNGAGIRYKALVQVYAMGLYLPARAATSAQVYAAAGPKRITLTLLREVNSAELGKAFTRGFEDNAPKEQMSRLIPGLLQQGDIFATQKKLTAGDTVTIDWVPGAGTVISVKGVAQGKPIPEPEFFVAMLRIWLGPQPADWKLKDALLGVVATASPNT